jgi:hypothetical protein
MAIGIKKLQQPYDPSVTSASHDAMQEPLHQARDVFGGTRTMAAKSSVYLPKFEKEKDSAYKLRRAAARLRRNMFRQAVERVTGRIFEVPVRLKDSELPISKAIADDADLKGKSLDRVARNLYAEALKCGLAHILVDYPTVNAANLAEERAARARPYFVVIKPEAVLRCFEDEDGVITHLAWMEGTSNWNETTGEEQITIRIHERFPGRSRSWKTTDVTRSGAKPIGQQARGWELEGSEKTVSQQKIMFHTLYAEEVGHMIGRTPLEEVQDLTIEHFQISSDYRNCLQHVLFPILTATGVEQKDIGDLVLGPDTILGSTKSDATFAYLEHTGKAIEAGFKDLESLEQRAEAYAGRLTKATGDVKATTESINSAEVSSFAKDMAVSLQDMLQAALDDCALWVKVETLGKVEVNMDFAVDLPDGDITALQSMRSNGDISRPTIWNEMQRRNVLSRDFDPKAEEEALAEQEQEAMKREQEAMKFTASLEPPPGGPS